MLKIYDVIICEENWVGSIMICEECFKDYVLAEVMSKARIKDKKYVCEFCERGQNDG